MIEREDNNLKKIDKNYHSPEDFLLNELQAKFPLSESQRATIVKHEKIAQLRDDPNAQAADSVLWEKF